MTITKLGHCCLVIKEAGLTMLTDPGTYSTGQDTLTGIDIVLITHEHQDHYHIDSVKKILANNPQAKIYTVKGVGVLLDKEGIAYQLLEHGGSVVEKAVTIEAYGQKHAEIYSELPSVDNTGFFIANRLWYPGDAFTDPGKPVEILALPVAGPWMKISEAVDYALELKPKIVFPVHDGILKNVGLGHFVPSMFLPKAGIEFKPLLEGESFDVS